MLVRGLQAIRRPPSRPREIAPGTRMALGPALHLARATVTATHPYLCIRSHDRLVSIQGDTRGGGYYIRYHGEYHEALTTAEVVQWLIRRNQALTLANAWDVLIFANLDQLATMLG